MNRHENLAKVSKDLMLKEPFYGLFLIMLNKVWTDKVPTAGVGRNGINYQLYINPEFWDSLTDIQRMGLLKHELLHIGFFHVTDFGHLTDKDVCNIAMDVEINQYIDQSWLPEGGCLLKDVNKSYGLDMKKKMGTKYYYDELMKIKNQLQEELKQYLRDTHAGWEEFDDMDEATQKLIQKQTEHILKEVAEQVKKSTGSIPGEFQQLLDKINTKEAAKFDWRGYLRRFAGSSMDIYTKKLRRKPNKRFEENPGLKIKKRRHILVGVDTSGSVSTDELKEFFHEIHHIHKTGCEVTVIQCDTSINAIDKFKPNLDIKIAGRGGTSFHPVVEYYNENRDKYSTLIYLTDGEASAPEKARGKMLWVLSSKSKRNEDLIGPQIVLN